MAASDDTRRIQANAFSQTTVLKVGYASIGVVSLIVVARIALQSVRPRRLAPGDYLIFFAYTLFVSQCALYIAMAPVRLRVDDVTYGRRRPYATIMDDAKMIGKLYFPALLFFWTIIWSVKFALLLLYRKLIIGLGSIYNRLWWFMAVLCGVTLIGNYIAFLTTCEKLSSFFEGEACFDRTRQYTSLWFSYSVDTVTNIMLIAYPMHLTWSLQMPRGQKVALLLLFSSGVCCIIIATLRAAQITANTLRTHAALDGTWLAVWSLVESAVAVVIGLCPSFAVLLRAARLATKKTSQNGQGYVKQDGAGFNLQTIGSHSTRKKTRGHNADLTETFWSDTHSSQEELAGKPSEIHVSTTIQQQSQNFGPGK